MLAPCRVFSHTPIIGSSSESDNFQPADNRNDDDDDEDDDIRGKDKVSDNNGSDTSSDDDDDVFGNQDEKASRTPVKTPTKKAAPREKKAAVR